MGEGYNMHTSKVYPKVFVIVVNYNGKETLKSCLKSLFCSDYPNLEVVVVDNNSKDGSIEMVKSQFSRAHYIMLEKNVGFAAGNNQGIRFALEKQAKYVFLLNNDAFVDKNTISQLIQSSKKHHDRVMLSPIIYTAGRLQKRVWFCGGRIDWKHMRAVHAPCKDISQKTYTTEYITGCAMLIPQQIFQNVGLFDEKYFLYYEDVDLCVRAQKEGFSCSVVPTASVSHSEQSTHNPDKLYWLVVSGILFFTSAAAKHPLRTHLYLLARKCKNTIDIFRKKDMQKAKIIRKAFQDAKKGIIRNISG
jgi:GT2 family glycosyltransferase